MSRLSFDIKESIIAMVEGNPGATMVLMEMLKVSHKIDPDSLLGSLGALTALDEYGIYGTDIYVLYNDICDRDNVKFLATLRAVQLGFLELSVLKDAAHRQDYSGKSLINTEEILSRVKERLPNFGREG